MAGKQRSATPGSVTRAPNGRWRVRVEVGRNLDGTRRVIRGTYDTRAEAEDARVALVAQMRADPRLGSRVTLAQYWETRFEPSRAAYLTNATMDMYRGYWRRYVLPRLGSRPISELRFSDVQAAMSGMTRGCAKHFAATVRAIVSAAWADDVIAANPLHGRHFRFPGTDAGPLPVWGAEEVARAIVALEGTPLYRVWLVMVGSGMRREEACALHEGDITYDRVERMVPGGGSVSCVVAHATVREALTVQDGRKAPKNPRSVRTVDIAEPFSSALLEGAPDDHTAPLCPIAISGVSRAWKKLWEPSGFGPDADPRFYKGRMVGSGVPYVTLSRMRATHETLMQAAGVADTLNAAIHGRTNVQTGYRHYLAPKSDAQVAAAQAVGDRVSAAM